MVLENLINPKKAEERPWRLFLLGMIYSSVGILAALWIFRDYASLVSIFFTVLAAVPTVYFTIKNEQEKDMRIEKESILLKEHGKALAAFTFLFLGFLASYVLWYSFLPGDLLGNVFSIQQETLYRINGPTGNAINLGAVFGLILFNNIKVLIFCLIFAFFYGFGAIFILTWNASVIAAAMGDLIRTQISSVAVVPLVILRYLIHGIPEMMAYFMAGLAGGIISIAVIRHDIGSKQFKRILIDSVDLSFGAIALLVFAAVLEIFVSPLFG